jgi:biopolymer transport protein ExbD
MAASAYRARWRPAADPNVIPFIDVLLVLLIIFMATAPKPTTDLRVDLPRPGPEVQFVIPPTIVHIRQAANGAGLFIGSEAIDRGDLAQRTLAHMLAADPGISAAHALAEGRVFVRADLGVAYQDVVSVVDDLQRARFRQVAIVAQDADAVQ